jgi:hypothetical protein
MEGVGGWNRMNHVPELFRGGPADDVRAAVLANPAHQRAHKRRLPVQVRFAVQPEVIRSAEGNVPAQMGDAIITGVLGEQWPVPRERFESRYEPLAPLVCGQDGAYLCKPTQVLALRMESHFEVLLSDGVSRLSGAPGDWLMAFDDGGLGIIDDAIFRMTYEFAA